MGGWWRRNSTESPPASMYPQAYAQELYFIAMLLSVVYRIAKYPKGNKSYGQVTRRVCSTQCSFPLETFSNLFCLFQISLHVLTSVFWRLMELFSLKPKSVGYMCWEALSPPLLIRPPATHLLHLMWLLIASEIKPKFCLACVLLFIYSSFIVEPSLFATVQIRHSPVLKLPQRL